MPYKYVYFQECAGNWRRVRFGVIHGSLFISWTVHIAIVYACLNKATFGHNLIYIRENKPKWFNLDGYGDWNNTSNFQFARRIPD